MTMTAVAAGRSDLPRWLASAAVVLGLHAAGVTFVALWRAPISAGDAGAPIVVEFAPIAAAPDETVDNLAPGPVQEKYEPPPELSVETPQEKIEKIEPPPDVRPEVALPPEPVKPAPPKPIEKPRAPATTAPQRQPRVAALPAAPAVGATSENRAAAASWHGLILAQIERHKGYPEEARAHGDKGTAQVAFTLDRQGRVLASRIVRSSGFPALDQETMATVRRAQPFPPPPADVPGATFNFSVPIRFNLR